MKTADSVFIKSMTLRYIFALSVLALIAIVADYILQEKIEAEQSRGAVINSCGRLRMLSQRIAFYSLRLVGSSSPSERAALRKELLEATNLMENSFNKLITDHQALTPSGQLQEEVHKFLTAAKSILELPPANLNSTNSDLQYLLSVASSDLLHRLDQLANQYQRESENGIARLQKLERTVMLITILVLLLMAVLIFRPLVRRIQIYLGERRQIEEEREKLIDELRVALANVKTLRGLIPICASCKKIRDDGGYWNQLETYLEEHSDAGFTHGFCPECQKNFEAS
jgi:nitrate/nitrite-specific signal transduction histidine kinase